MKGQAFEAGGVQANNIAAGADGAVHQDYAAQYNTVPGQGGCWVFMPYRDANGTAHPWAAGVPNGVQAQFNNHGLYVFMQFTPFGN